MVCMPKAADRGAATAACAVRARACHSHGRVLARGSHGAHAALALAQRRGPNAQPTRANTAHTPAASSPAALSVASCPAQASTTDTNTTPAAAPASTELPQPEWLPEAAVPALAFLNSTTFKLQDRSVIAGSSARAGGGASPRPVQHLHAHHTLAPPHHTHSDVYKNTLKQYVDSPYFKDSTGFKTLPETINGRAAMLGAAGFAEHARCDVAAAQHALKPHAPANPALHARTRTKHWQGSWPARAQRCLAPAPCCSRSPRCRSQWC
jgi:hypothetical protein